MTAIALIGRNIAHSLSGEIYSRLLGTEIDFHLIDCPCESNIPPLEKLFPRFHGVSITSPYKMFFFNKVVTDDNALFAGSVNCLRKESSGFTGTNTDLFAIRAILLKHMNSQAALKITILGDGAMSRLTTRILAQMGIPFVVHSRKTRSDFHAMDLGYEGPGLVINTCSRDFIFQGTLGPETIFWDFNYDFPPHRQFLPSRCKSYQDGQEMLELQARENLRFWDLLHR